MIKLTWNQVNLRIDELLKKVDISNYDGIYGVPRGGMPIALIVSQKTGLSIIESIIESEKPLVVDDIIDSGNTRLRYSDYDFISLFDAKEVNDWIEFPWERMNNEAPAEDAVIRLIEFIGEDSKREGLVETPKRVIKAYEYLFSGYKQNPSDFVKTFGEEAKCDEMVLLKDIEIYSMCEHHMLPFWGKAHIAYIPNERVIGVSKLARIADMYSRRLQIQERLVDQITTCLMDELKPKGAACVIEAAHFCMRMRGVQKQNSTMITSSLKGVFLDKQEVRQEFMNLIKK